MVQYSSVQSLKIHYWYFLLTKIVQHSPLFLLLAVIFASIDLIIASATCMNLLMSIHQKSLCFVALQTMLQLWLWLLQEKQSFLVCTHDRLTTNKVQQIPCCQIYAPFDLYQCQSNWYRYTKSQIVWYAIIWSNAMPRIPSSFSYRIFLIYRVCFFLNSSLPIFHLYL